MLQERGGKNAEAQLSHTSDSALSQHLSALAFRRRTARAFTIEHEKWSEKPKAAHHPFWHAAPRLVAFPIFQFVELWCSSTPGSARELAGRPFAKRSLISCVAGGGGGGGSGGGGRGGGGSGGSAEAAAAAEAAVEGTAAVAAAAVARWRCGYRGLRRK